MIYCILKIYKKQFNGYKKLMVECISKDGNIVHKRLHAINKHPLYSIWEHMKWRCYNAKSNRYHRYGLRGITVCEEWIRNPKEFINWGLRNGWKPGLTIDRINNDFGYSPDNCQFLTISENSKKMFNDKAR